jgi:hypothetical protein
VALAMTYFTGPVAAGPSEFSSDTRWRLICDNLENDSGSASVSAVESERTGSFGELSFTESTVPPESGDPTWIGVTDIVAFGTTSVSATFDVVEFVPPPGAGDSVGTAALTATLTPAGDPEPYEVRSTGTNHKLRRSGVRQDFTVAGTLQLPMGITFDLSSCVAERDTFSEFRNSPASSVFHESQFVLVCGWNVDGTSIDLIADADQFETGANLFVDSATASFFGEPASDVTLTTETFAAAFELFERFHGVPAGGPVGTADASATFTEGGRINERSVSGTDKAHITGRAFLADGSLEITTPDATFDLAIDGATCSASDQRVTEHFSARNDLGRDPPLMNDAPNRFSR